MKPPHPKFDVKSCANEFSYENIFSASEFYRFKLERGHNRRCRLEIEELQIKKISYAPCKFDPENKKECKIQIDFTSIDDLMEQEIVTLNPLEFVPFLEQL